MTNEYTKEWQDTFLRPESPRGPRRENTAIQVDFLRDHLPLPEFSKVLDVCCGLGRHSIPLSEAGYDVLGIDRDENLIVQAQQAGSRARFAAMDMRDIEKLEATFDAVICMWQSFGYFDATTNEMILRSMARSIRPGGRVVLDIYNKNYFSAVKRRGYEEHHMNEAFDSRQSLRFEYPDRLDVVIEWASGKSDHFSWQLFSPDDLVRIAEGCNLRSLVVCTEFNPQQVVGNRRKDFQALFERVS